ncbi:hypothetical protein [Geobacter pickeringii]|uniref:Uncharacterized protein n=1 Tax=Geobacter pickeringii TaxID=345632 RepID=A0A0B5BFY6_9BACT|nr:hypothetical protein [Geobacter pickeringii]AJE03435.1 hypothetical protein GPICK_08775 [Geobacter pickeringii]
MLVLRDEDIQAIAEAVVVKLRPLLFPEYRGEPVEAEIARVRASGQDPTAYLKERAKHGKKRR